MDLSLQLVLHECFVLEIEGGQRKVENGREGKGERIARGESKSREARALLTEFGIARGLAVAHVNL